MPLSCPPAQLAMHPGYSEMPSCHVSALRVVAISHLDRQTDCFGMIASALDLVQCNHCSLPGHGRTGRALPSTRSSVPSVPEPTHALDSGPHVLRS